MSDLNPVYDDFGVPMNEPLELRPMTLRDALAAALYGYLWSEPSEGRFLDEPEEWYCPPNELADAILADPAFREALAEAVGDALYADGLQVRRQNVVLGWMTADEVARAIVERMLP